MEAVNTGGRLKRHCWAQLAGALLVERLRFSARCIVGQLVEMLAGLEVRGVERKSASQCGARSGTVAEQPVLGCSLNQRGDQMASRHIGCHPVVGIGGVERRGPLIFLQRLFKLAIQE